jgi:ppGpp synthetase/RelA/SpoT-type nucleotidyltranferase
MNEESTPDGQAADPDADRLQAIKERAHEARIQYEAQRGLYHDFAHDIARLIEACLNGQSIHYHSITAREKDPDSFERKAAKTSDDDPMVAKYEDPLLQITDKAAIRITTYFLEAVDVVSKLASEEFVVIERLNKASSEPDRLGYQSIHYLVQHLPRRTSLPEYRRFAGLTAEIQIRTILQHAWAEIEHDIQYKAIAAVPERIRRRFTALAGLIEIADREFQAIATEDASVRAQARINIDSGRLDQVEITRDSFKEYIDKKYGPDGRMREWSYDYTVRLLLTIGFKNLAEVDECISGFDDDAVSRAMYGSRLGQLTRFEYVLLASMGDYYIMAHPWVRQDPADWYLGHCIKRLANLSECGISAGTYRPAAYPDTRLSLSELAKLKNDFDLANSSREPLPPEQTSPDAGS